jgi:hypothetical protein
LWLAMAGRIVSAPLVNCELHLFICPQVNSMIKMRSPIGDRLCFNSQFSQMRVSEGRGCLQTMPSGSILDKTPFCQFSIFNLQSTHSPLRLWCRG